LLSTLLLCSFAAATAAVEPSLADSELQHLHSMLYPCYLLRLQGWDVLSGVV
jgi:hypothetical protein